MEQDPMITKKLILTNQHGLHARAADKLVKTALQYPCDIEVTCNKRRANAKSIIGVMTLGAGGGAEIEVTVNGQDETAALAALESLVADDFGEAK